MNVIDFQMNCIVTRRQVRLIKNNLEALGSHPVDRQHQDRDQGCHAHEQCYKEGRGFLAEQLTGRLLATELNIQSALFSLTDIRIVIHVQVIIDLINCATLLTMALCLSRVEKVLTSPKLAAVLSGLSTAALLLVLEHGRHTCVSYLRDRSSGTR